MGNSLIAHRHSFPLEVTRRMPRPPFTSRSLVVGAVVVLAATLASGATGASATAVPSLGQAGPANMQAYAALRPPVAFPAHPQGLPRQGPWGGHLDNPAGYQPQQACVAAPSRGIVKLRAPRTQDLRPWRQQPGHALAPAPPAARRSTRTAGPGTGCSTCGNVADRRAAANFLRLGHRSRTERQRGEMAAPPRHHVRDLQPQAGRHTAASWRDVHRI